MNSFQLHDPSFWKFEDHHLSGALSDLAVRDESILARVNAMEARLLAKITALEAEVERLKEALADKQSLTRDFKRGRGTPPRGGVAV